jgi:hypothetical protein
MKQIFSKHRLRPARHLAVSTWLMLLWLWPQLLFAGAAPAPDDDSPVCAPKAQATCRIGKVCKNGDCVDQGQQGFRFNPKDQNLWRQIWQTGHSEQIDGAILTASRDEIAGLLDCANLVGRAQQRLLGRYANRNKSADNTPIVIDGTDFAGFMAVGRDIVRYSQTTAANLTMDIGTADATNAQTWTLPAGLMANLGSSPDRSICVSPANIPTNAKDPATTHALRLSFGTRQSYQCFGVKPGEVAYLGNGNDFTDPGATDTFKDSGPDASDTWADVPLNLGDSWTDAFDLDLTDDPAGAAGQRVEMDQSVNYDAFGTLVTPFGSFQALRQTTTVTYKTFPSQTATVPTSTSTQKVVVWATKEGLMVQAKIVGSPTSGTVQLTEFQILNSVPTGTLPVSLKYFSARIAASHSVLLDWQTASEQNAKEFQVGRSQNLWQFDPVGTIPATGNTNTTQTYALTDETPLPGTSYYRLRQVDQNGKYQDFKPVAVTLDNPTGLLFPNPSDGRSVRVRAPESVPMQLHSTEGRAVPFSRRAVEAGVQEVTPASVLKAGVYLLTVGSETFKWMVR